MRSCETSITGAKTLTAWAWIKHHDWQTRSLNSTSLPWYGVDNNTGDVHGALSPIAARAVRKKIILACCTVGLLQVDLPSLGVRSHFDVTRPWRFLRAQDRQRRSSISSLRDFSGVLGYNGGDRSPLDRFAAHTTINNVYGNTFGG